jgi:hypothetical protein
VANGRAGSGNGGRRRDVWKAGVLSGVLAAVAMMAFMAVVSAVDGGAPLDALRAVGTTLRGADASTEGPLPVAWGAFLHLVVGAGLGVAFTALVPKDLGGSASAVLGAGSGLIAMAFALMALVPRLAPGLQPRMSAHGGAWVIAHALFGAVLGLGPWLWRRMEERTRPGRPEERPGVLRPRTSP